MFIHLLKARSVAAQSTNQSTALATRSVFATIRHAMMILGVSAICTLGVMFVKPDIADQLIALSPFADKASIEQKAELVRLSVLVVPPVATEAAAPAATPPDTQAIRASASAKALGTQRQQQWVTEWISKRYRVAGDAANMLVSAAYLTAVENKLDPMLILAVIAIESRFNPFAESAMGAQGLMQVMSKVHKDKFEDHGGVQAALNPVANIQVGTKILKEYVKRGGSVEAGLKSYVGAAALESDSGYGAKVLAEYRKLKDVASGKKVPVGTSVAHAKRQNKNVDNEESTASSDAVEKDTIVALEEKTRKL